MDTSISRALGKLSQGELLRIRDGRGQGIAVFHGRVWITQHDDPRDVVLDGGESFVFDRPGLTIVQALSDTSLLVFGAIAYSANDASWNTAGPTPPPMTSQELHRLAKRLRNTAIHDAVRGMVAKARLQWARMRALA